MRITFDPEADAMYIYVGDGSFSNKTQEIDQDTIIDLNDRGNLVGIELLWVSDRMPSDVVDGIKNSRKFAGLDVEILGGTKKMRA